MILCLRERQCGAFSFLFSTDPGIEPTRMTTMSIPQNDLWLAFQDGYQFRLNESEVTVTMRQTDAGALLLPTGRIVASDPILDPWNAPFTITVPPGTYPVHLALGNEDVAFVGVFFNEGMPVRWKKAKPGSFSVDSATGCLMDHRLNRFLRQKAIDGKYERYVAQVTAEN
jgi:Protein of unknown function (DUF4241)